MSAPISAVEICTLAADLIKATEVDSLDDPKETIEEFSARWWDTSRRQAFRLYRPNFAKKPDTISRNSTAPAFQYDDSYALPNDYVIIHAIENSKIPLSHWDYEIYGNDLYINNSGSSSLAIVYIFDQTAVVKWDELFKKAVAFELALNICYGITGQKTLVTLLERGRDKFRAEMRSMNGQENPPSYNLYSPAAAARRKYAGGFGYYTTGRTRV